MEKFIEEVRNSEQKQILDLMYAQEQYVEEPPPMEALKFTVQQHLRMRGTSRTDHFRELPLRPCFNYGDPSHFVIIRTVVLANRYNNNCIRVIPIYPAVGPVPLTPIA